MSVEYTLVPTSLCKICQFNSQNTTIPQCNHQFCLNCLKSYLFIKITEGNVLAITCPEPDCPTSLSSELIQSLLPDQSEKYLYFTSKKQKELNPNFRWCPYSNCSGFDEKLDSNKLNCNQCKLAFCYVCTEPWHEGLCKDATIKGFKRCPKCAVVIEKFFGCLEIGCTVCGFKFCWLCGQGVGRHSFSKCVFVSKNYWFYWIFSVFLMFYPVVLVFFIPILMILFIFSDDGVDRFRRDRNLYVFGFVAGTLLSPVFLPVIAVICLVAGPIPFIIVAIRRYKKESNTKLIILLGLLPFYYVLLDMGFVLVFLISLVFIPLFGIGLFIYKLILICH